MRFGPIIKGAFSVPNALAPLLTAKGHPVPKPVEGYLLIDTGASTLCVAEAVTRELGLNPVGLKDTSGLHGRQQNEIYHIHLTLFFSRGGTELVTIENEKAVLSVPRLDEHWKPTDIQTGDDHPTRLIGLLGRDFLRHATLTYNGTTGLIDVALDLSTMPAHPPGISKS
jgi:hypothetical protein